MRQAIISGGAKFDSHGNGVAHGSADTFILDFEDQNQPSRAHMVKNARMRQDPRRTSREPADSPWRLPPTGSIFNWPMETS